MSRTVPMIPADTPGMVAMPAPPSGLLGRLEWRARRAVTNSISGDYLSVFRGRGMEFDQVVKYEWGDDPRAIDWNVTARLGEPYCKRFIQERDLTVVFVFEDSPALQFGSGERTRRETLLQAAALLMVISAANRDRIGLLYTSPAGHWYERALSGRRDMLRVATKLLSQPPPPLDQSATCAIPWNLMRKIANRGSVMLWFGPFLPAPLPDSWRELQQRYQAVGVRADDPWDVELPADSRFAAYDPLAGRLTTIDTSAVAERAAHRRWRGEREGHFSHLFPRLADRLKIGNAEDPLDALVGYFHRLGASGRAA